LTYNNRPICWISKKQSTASLSSTEAEYVAICEACKDVYVKCLISELTKDVGVTTIYNDNQSAGKLVENPVFHKRTKHISIKNYFLRELAENGQVNVKQLPSTEMPADMLTALSAGKL
jgi:transcription elongation factor Elf1